MQGFEDAQDGSWFISAKVNNDKVWDLVKGGQLKGFSVEGIFGYKQPEPTPEEAIIQQIAHILNGKED